jgi:hypothetical protein
MKRDAEMFYDFGDSGFIGRSNVFFDVRLHSRAWFLP